MKPLNDSLHLSHRALSFAHLRCLSSNTRLRGLRGEFRLSMTIVTGALTQLKLDHQPFFRLIVFNREGQDPFSLLLPKRYDMSNNRASDLNIYPHTW